MQCFDGGDEDSADADAVAAHDHRVTRALIVEERRAQRLRVHRAELEHVADFDALLRDQFPAVIFR